MAQKLDWQITEIAYLVVEDGSIDLEMESKDGETQAEVTIEWIDGKFHVTGEAETVTGWYPQTWDTPAEPKGFRYDDLAFKSVKIAEVMAHLEDHDLVDWKYS